MTNELKSILQKQKEIVVGCDIALGNSATIINPTSVRPINTNGIRSLTLVTLREASLNSIRACDKSLGIRTILDRHKR